MVCGVGVDLVDVGRIRRLRKRWGDRFLNKVFTAAELDKSLTSVLWDQRLAARFAAKEAFLKAVGTGLALGARWREIEVCIDRLGAPSLNISGSAAGLMQSKGAGTAHLAISHTASTAVAFVVLGS